MNETRSLLFFCFFMGIFLVWFGIMVQIGRYKQWWLIESTPIVPTSFAYVVIPTGLLVLMVSGLLVYPASPNTRGMAFTILIFPMLLIIIILSMWQPSWLTPKWLRWLKKHYGYLIPLLRVDAIKMGKRNWERQVNTQEGLEEWAEKVWQKNKFDHPDQRFIGDPHA